MPFNAVIPGLGIKVSYCATEGGSYTEVGQLKSVDGLAAEVGMYDSTGLASTAAEQVPTLFKAGEFGFATIFDPSNATHVALAAALVAKTLSYWKFIFPSPIGPGASAPGSPKSYNFAGYLNKFATSGHEVEGGAEAAFGLGITGPLTVV